MRARAVPLCPLARWDSVLARRHGALRRRSSRKSAGVRVRYGGSIESAAARTMARTAEICSSVALSSRRALLRDAHRHAA